MNLKNFLRVLFTLGVLTILVSASTFAQTTWYVNNQIGNDGRNGLSATIPVPDDNVTGPKKTIDGPQGAIPSSVAGDIIVVANTGVSYSTGTGEPATIIANQKQIFQSTGGAVTVTSLFQVNNAAAAPNNTVTFNSGAFSLTNGLTLTVGSLINSSQLLTVTGLITRTVAAATVSGQLLYTGTVSFSYGATMTTADEFPNSGTFANLTTTAGNLTLKTTSAQMTGTLTLAGTLNLGGNVFTLANSAPQVHTLGGNVTGGTLAFIMGSGNNVTVNGAFNIPTVTVTTNPTATAATLALAQPTAITGTITVSGHATVTTSAALVTLGTPGFTGDEITLNGIGDITLSGAPTTVNGNVVVSSTGLVGGNAPGARIIFAGAGALTVNGNVSNLASFTAANDATLNRSGGGQSDLGEITFPNQIITITGNVVNNVVLGGTIGAAANVQNVGQIQFTNTGTNVIINGAMNNGSYTAITGSTGVAYSGIGNITFGNNPTTAVIRIDGGISSSSSWSGITNAGNSNNGQIILGGAARTAGSTIGTALNRIASVTNTSLGRANGDGNGNIVIGAGDGTAGGFFGTSVSASGSSIGGYNIFGNESFNITGNLVLSRSNTGGLNVIQVGNGLVAAATVSIGGNLDNESSNIILFNISNNGAVGVTGGLISNGSGQISFPNLAAGSFTVGSLTVSNGTVSIPVTHAASVAITGAASVSGGLVSFLAAGGVNISIGGAASFTGGAVTATGRTDITLNGNTLTFGGASSNTTFNTAATTIILGTPSPTSLVNVAIGTFNPIIAGNFQVNNITGLATAVSVTGGTIQVNGNLTFTAGAVQLTNQATFLVVGNLLNTAGYTTTQQARISLLGAASTFGGAGNFGTIEFNNGAAGFATSSPVTLTGTIYLTSGTVSNAGGAITVNNSTVLPTVVLNAGSFLQVPTYNSNVNITYIGTDKTTGNELPASATTLQNLTVATTNGQTAGKGAVLLGASATVNGTLTVFSGQALVIGNGNALTMKGSSIVLSGDLTNNGTGVLVLGAATGTTVTGTGYLPNVQVAAGSHNNMLNGAAIISGLLGADNKRGGGDDFDPTAASANGTVVFNGANSSVSLNITGVAFDGTDLASITTNAGGQDSLYLAANLDLAGDITHPAGVINLGANTLFYLGTTPSITGGAQILGTGTLEFDGAAKTLSCVATDVTIAANVKINLATAGTKLTIDPANAGNLILAGNLTVTKGDVVLGNGGAARNLTMTGSNLTLTANGTIDVGAVSIGTLRLNAAVAPLTLTYTGTPTISRLRISNDVNLAGTGTALTVTNAFTHDGGVLNFGTRDLTFNAFARTAGSYLATSGYMIFGGAVAVSQGATGFSVPNLRVTGAGSLNPAGGTVTVTGLFDMNAGGGTFTANGKLAIADGVTVNFLNGTLDAAPAYAGSIKLVLANTASQTIPSKIWTATVPVTDLTVNCGAFTASLPAAQNVTANLNLTAGTLECNNFNLTTGTGANINVVSGLLTNVGGGNFVPGTSNNISYAVTAAYGSGLELPATVNNFTVGRTGNVANNAVTVNSNVAIAGTLTVSNNLTAAATISTSGNIVVSDAANTLATPTVLSFAVAASPLTFTGTTQTFALGGNRTVTNINVNQTGTNPSVTVSGGNLTVGFGGNIALNNGLFIISGANSLILPSAVQGYTHNIAGNLSHVVGNVQKALATSQTGRFEFPVGTMTSYRPVAFTFGSPTSAAVITATNLIVSADSTNPGGTNGFPLSINGITVDTTANFSWTIASSVSLGPSQTFDVEFQGTGFTNYSNVADIRAIARLGGVVTNPWLGQTGAYSNFEAVAGLPIVRVTGSTGNLISQTAKFTLGFKKPTPTSFAVSGKITYGNGASGVKNVVVTLNPGGMTATTDTTGAYTFANVANGSYTLTATTANAWLGANATDALLASNYYNGTATLTSIQQLAADVNKSNTVNNTDALLIVRRFAGLDNSFAAGNWVFTSANITVNGAAVTANLLGLVAGDVNASDNLSTLKVQPSVSLTNEGTLKVNPKDAFGVPVNVTNSASLGAVSLRFTYPTDLVTFEGASSSANLIVNEKNGQVTVAWADLSGGKNPLSLKSGESLVTLKFKPTANFKVGSQFGLNLDGQYSEFAKEDGSVIGNATLAAASIEASVPTEFALKQNYPNPFNPSTTIEYDLPMNASVRLAIYNILGEQISTLVDQVQSAGSYKVVWNANNLASGMYIYRITVEAGSQKFTQIHRMMLLK